MVLSSFPRVPCLFAALTISLAACDSGPAPEAADLVLRGGKIVTVDEAIPEVQALAARDGRIVAIGSDADIDDYIGDDTEVIELDGKLAIPGFIEGHAHYMGVGRSTLQLNLMEVANWDEVVAIVDGRPVDPEVRLGQPTERRKQLSP